MSEKISFIGAGIATSYTLIPLIDKLITAKKKVNLYIIDKTENFYQGIPYGKQSGEAVLLINDLKSFIPIEAYRKNFTDWLDVNLNDLIDDFSSTGCELSKSWIINNSDDMRAGNWDNLYIPRFFFGKYIKDQIDKQILKVKESDHITIKEIKNEAIDIQRLKNGFDIQFIDKSTLRCNKIVLSTGSLPNKKIFKSNLKIPHTLKYVDNLYQPTIDNNINEVAKVLALRNKNKLKTSILVLGANASGLEAIYRIFDQTSFKSELNTFTCLSTHGTMPDGKINHEKLSRFNTINLDDLLKYNTLTADQIAEAVNKDLDFAESLNLGAASTVSRISKGFGKLLTRLNKDELIKFACYHGNQIGRRQRCAGTHYLSVIDKLIKEQRFFQIKGRFNNLELCDNSFKLEFLSSEQNQINTQLNFHIVINCLGSVNLESPHIPELYKNIFEKKLASINASKIGLKVDGDMQSSKNFYIAGPMLAGNLIEDRALWHLEHCGRIIWSSKILSEKIYNDI